MTKTKAALLMLIAAAAGGCSQDPQSGYTMKNLYLENIHSVAVPMWSRGRDVYRRDNETRLTEAICKQIELDTPYKIMDRSRADTLLTGTIENIVQTTLGSNPDTGLPREIEINMYISMRWTDLRSGDVLVDRKFNVSATYLPGKPFNEDYFLGSEDVINRLAAQIVEQMEKPYTKG